MTTLAQFPEILRAVVAAVPEEQWRTRGPDDFFALVEHTHHLADLEEEGYARRIERLLGEDAPMLPDFRGDVIAQERHYIDQPLLPALERFCATREANVARFATLTDEEWTRSGTQEGAGTIDVRRVHDMMLEHDAEHAEQLIELLASLGIAAPASLSY
jgi:hypothetical protein